MPPQDKARASRARSAHPSVARAQTRRAESGSPRKSQATEENDAPPARRAVPRGDARPNARARPGGLDRVQAARECRPPRRDRAMGVLLDLSRSEIAPPQPADLRLCELGFATWETALAEAADRDDADRARAWAASEPGRRLLAAVFGNSPFLTSLATKEWRLLLRLVEHGPDAVFREIVGAVETESGWNENQAVLMRQLRRARGCVALVAGIAELAGSWSLEQIGRA